MTTRTLMYHALESRDHPTELEDPGDRVYLLSVADFIAQLDWLDENPELPAELTFDDGHVTNHRLALPILQQRKRHATFFVTTDWIGTPNFMTAPMIRELADSGMRIGSHGASHRFLTDLGEQEAAHELRASKQRLEDIIGSNVTTLSAPGGRIDARIGELAAAAGFREIHTSDATPSFALPGLAVVGRIALKRHYTPRDFVKLMHTGRAPESALRQHGLALAKRVLGNQRYERLRALAFRMTSRSR